MADGAAAQHRAGAQGAGAGGVGDDLTKVQRHGGAYVAQADLAAVPVGLQPQVQAAPVPSVAQLVERDRYWTEGGGRTRLKQPAAPLALGLHQVVQTHGVGQQHQADAGQRLLGRGAARHIAGDDRHLGGKVDAQRLAGDDDVITRTQKVVAGALVQ